VARTILADWDAAKGRFWKVFPHEYAAALKQQVRLLQLLHVVVVLHVTELIQKVTCSQNSRSSMPACPWRP
jgi:hypothetical protein